MVTTGEIAPFSAELGEILSVHIPDSNLPALTPNSPNVKSRLPNDIREGTILILNSYYQSSFRIRWYQFIDNAWKFKFQIYKS